MARRYELKRRAERQDDTRRRIVEATIGLHASVGVAATTVTRIAEEAGVSRLTVYRHFPDERSLLAACTGTYLADNPPPDAGRWAAISDPEARLRVALRELYRFYRRNEVLLARADQEMPSNPILAEVLTPYRTQIAQMQDLLSEGWCAGDGGRLVSAAIGHAVAFATWQSLAVAQGLTDDRAVALMVSLVRCAGEMPPGDRAREGVASISLG